MCDGFQKGLDLFQMGCRKPSSVRGDEVLGPQSKDGDMDNLDCIQRSTAGTAQDLEAKPCEEQRRKLGLVYAGKAEGP